MAILLLLDPNQYWEAGQVDLTPTAARPLEDLAAAQGEALLPPPLAEQVEQAAKAVPAEMGLATPRLLRCAAAAGVVASHPPGGTRQHLPAAMEDLG